MMKVSQKIFLSLKEICTFGVRVGGDIRNFFLRLIYLFIV